MQFKTIHKDHGGGYKGVKWLVLYIYRTVAYTGQVTKYQKHTAMYIWSPYISGYFSVHTVIRRDLNLGFKNIQKTIEN